MSIAEEFQAALGSAGYTFERQMERPGLTLAVVTNINDPDKLNRVKCLPVENDKEEETDWCYVMAPLGGKECGAFFFPNVNDLVVLGYLGGNPHRPMVLGGFWTPAEAFGAELEAHSTADLQTMLDQLVAQALEG